MARSAKVTGNSLIDTVMGKINAKKQIAFTAPAIKIVPPIPTGSLALDIAIGIGGLPQGRIVEIFASEASAKTSLSLFWAAQAQKIFPDKYVLIVDLESTMTEDFILGFGLDPTRYVFISPENANEALNAVLDFIKTGQFCFLVFDSIDTCLSEQQLQKDLSENDMMGGVSKLLARFFREFAPICAKTNTTAIFINQTKATMAMYGPKKTTSGGSALRFYASLRIEASSIKPSENLSNAFIVKLNIRKNKMGPVDPDPIEFDFIRNKGPDRRLDVLNAAKKAGILVSRGQNLCIAKDLTKLCRGKEGWLELTTTQPEILDQIRELCIESHQNKTITVAAILDVEEEDEDELLDIIKEE